MLDINEFSIENITKRMKDGLKNNSSKNEGSFSMDNIQSVAQELSRITTMRFFDGLDHVFIDTAENEMLDRAASDYQMTRNKATSSKGVLVFSGTPQTSIPKGTLAITEELSFKTLSTVIIPLSGVISVPAECTTLGLIGNIKSNEIKDVSPTVNIPGLTATNNDPFIGGTDEENDDHFRSRILEKLRNPPGGGNEMDYVRWAKEVSGVGNAVCLPCYGGAGNVGIVVLSSSGGVPDDQIVKNVNDHILRYRPVGASINVIKAVAKDISIECLIKIVNGYTINDIENEFKQLLSSFLIDKPFGINKELSYYKISDLLFNVNGVEDIIDYTINDTKTSVTATQEEFFNIKEVIINVE